MHCGYSFDNTETLTILERYPLSHTEQMSKE